MKKGSKKKWLIGLAVVTALAQALATAGVAPPVLADIVLQVGELLLPVESL